MDEREYEQGYANFHRGLNRILRNRDVRAFKTYIARHPGQAGRLSHCLGLSDELAEIEMYKAILVRSALEDLHEEARGWLEERNIAPPSRGAGRGKRKGRRHFKKRGKKTNERK
ncbi:MAG: hypothetical protein JRH13_10800 [Deltaproteobacteria bacterium]|nr:hypothetical protein [Deltaproteobacteria bacterium]MBW2018216.1 hypothetical protein [Deltaproteobacteria bacterium]MBW2129840.1 hypothetical protein [Deltaproteobacteria bacterium]MBW2305204.1 hypothetical protein [Deltaproteobacteria bacterium]